MPADNFRSKEQAPATNHRGSDAHLSPEQGGGGVRTGRWGRLGSIHPLVPLGLLGLWMLLSGKMSFFHLGVGVVLVAAIVWQAASMELLDAPGRPRIRFLRAVPYGAWLFWQMLVSAVFVARVILWPSRHLDPRLIEFTCVQPSLLNGVILSGSITLTPGTVAVDLDNNRYIVHALTERGAREVLDGDMARRVSALSSDEPMPPIEVTEVVATPVKEES